MQVRIHRADEVREVVSRQLARVRELLGEPLSKLAAQARQRPERHPLLTAIDATEQWLALPNLRSSRIEGYLIEATGLGPLIEARASDPALPRLIASMVDPSQYLHAVGALGVAYAIQHTPEVKRVEFVEQSPGLQGRIPDLRVVLDHGREFYIEAKAPRQLRNRTRQISARVARRVVGNALSEARPILGQLPSDSVGMVAILSFGGGHATIRTLRETGRRFLEKVGPNDPMLMGVLIVDFRRTVRVMESSQGVDANGLPSVTARVRLAWGSHREMVQNPAYAGTFRVAVSPDYDPPEQHYDFSWSDEGPPQKRAPLA